MRTLATEYTHMQDFRLTHSSQRLLISVSMLEYRSTTVPTQGGWLGATKPLVVKIRHALEIMQQLQQIHRHTMSFPPNQV